MMIRVLLDYSKQFDINVHTYNELQRAIKQKHEYIITAQTSAFSLENVKKGYLVTAWDGSNQVNLNELFEYHGIRDGQNAEAMLLSGALGMVIERSQFGKPTPTNQKD